MTGPKRDASKRILKKKGEKKFMFSAGISELSCRQMKILMEQYKKCGCDGVRKEYVYFCTPILNFAS